MAGSLEHVLDGWSLIENMGDAYEAVEEMLWLVLSEIGEDKAKNLLNEKFFPMARGEIGDDDAMRRVNECMGA